MRLNEAGLMVQTVWDEIPHYYPGIEIDAFVIMPNHFHGIVSACRGSPPCLPLTANGNRPTKGNHGGVAPTVSLPDIVLRFQNINHETICGR